MKYGLIDSMRQTFPIAHMCRVLNVSESGFHAWRIRPPCERDRENARLKIEIQAAHQRTRETYSAKRLHSDLEDHGVHATPYRVRALRKKLGLRCKQKRKFKVTTDSKHRLPIAPNVLKREFTVSAPNKAWVSDITYSAPILRKYLLLILTKLEHVWNAFWSSEVAVNRMHAFCYEKA